MFVWEGFGLLVIFIYFAIAILMQLSIESLGFDYSTNEYAIASSFIISGAIILAVANSLSSKRQAEARIYIDKATGKEVSMHKTDTFFWLPMRWWGLVAIGLGLLSAVCTLLFALVGIDFRL